ncbi:uncharacterized protein LOC110732084 [Chenopodium quinoa]|uniref:uncharacterized protein LOC110732084 n=1 Tax=Chenopodium quinoa TaxID=63459 RepID=UPI000B791645|nr:uncharacterized protein LOC110732084 [Chenopodium quinoa]
MGALLAQYQEGTRKDIAIYYLNKKFLEYETRYTPLERACIALIYATKKLRHHLQAHTTYLIFESVKGRAISEALADGPISGDEFDDDFPNEHIFCLSTSQWKMYFDGASNRRGNGAGVLLIDPYGVHIPFAVKLSFPTTNNTAKYEACIYGIKAALAAGAKNLIVYGDSYLIISQTIGAWKVLDERLQMYTEYLQQFIPFFEEIEFKHLPREQNSFTDALANLAKYLIDGEYPEGSHKKDQLAIRRLASHFTILKGHLKETLEKYKIRHHQSSPYRPQTNGDVEAANKIIKTIIAKMTDRAREWPDKLPYALWGYRISIRTPTGTTPYSLVYGMDPLLPIETEIQSLRFA